MRIFLAGLAVAAGMASAAAACPTYSLSGATYSLTGDQLYAPQSLQVIAGGENNLANCPAPGVGYVATAPDFTFYLSGMDPYYLVLDVSAECDTTLLVNTADAQWHFDDDSNGNLAPRLELRGTTALNGRVDVWVGSYSGQYCNATLNMETFRSSGGQTGPGTPAPSLAGTWNWEAIGRTITIAANGTASDGINSATWTGPDPSGRYVISWSHGYTDYATLSPDGNRMELINNEGYRFGATRQPPNLGGDVIFPSERLIRVLSATYGANCGVPQGNATAHIAAQCNGQAQCDYRIDYTVIGDPAVGCSKEYDVSYDCGDGLVRRAHANAEAGFGSIVELQCMPAPVATPAPISWFQLVLVPEGISFDAARQRAAAMGGHLATITSPAELQAAWQVANNPAAWHVDDYGNSIGPWLGGLRGSVAGQPRRDWVWITGEPWGFTAWSPGEPNNSGGAESHLHFFAQGSQAGPTWNDISPNHPVRGFIVEFGSGFAGVGQPPAPQTGLAGTWFWEAIGRTIAINADGTGNDGVNSMVWSGPDANGTYTLRWSNGYTDYATLSADGSRMELVNNNGYRFGADRVGPAPSTVGTLSGRWNVNANGFTGSLVFTSTGTGWSAILNLGYEEVLQNVTFDPVTGRVEFLRPIPGLDQHYVGTLSGGQLSGQFNQTAGSPYSYSWSATR